MVFKNGNGLNNLKFVRDRITAFGGTINDNGDFNFVIQTDIDASKIQDIAFIPEVEWIDEYTPPISLMDNIRVFTGATSPLHEYGFSGTGIVGEVKDAGIDQDHVEFVGQLIGTDGNVDEDSHGTSTFGIVFAKGENERAMGMMPGGGGVFCDWGVQRKQSIANLVNNWDGVFQSNSWSSGSDDGSYASNTQQNDEAVFEYDVTMLYATGNGGSDGTISREASAKNVISVGAPSHYDNQDRTDDQHTGTQGNKGPTQDGRIKPDVVGPYDSIYTTTSGGGYTSGFGGTSGATPVAAGAVGLIYEMYRENHFKNNPSGTRPHASTVKAILIADAYQYEFSQGDRFAQGWGLVDAGNIYYVGENHLIEDETASLETGESMTYNVKPTGIHPLKISLVWTDHPATPGANPALINNLDLRVTAPDGTTVYWGNYGLESSKWSSQGGSADQINNVENLFIENPAMGEWNIEVIADNIALDGNIETSELDQEFALVASGVMTSDNDMVVSDMEEMPRYFKLNEEAEATGTISNIGFVDQANVMVNLLEDGVVVDTKTIGSIQSGTSEQVSMSWIPDTEGTSDITIEVLPVNGEDRLDNNEMTDNVDLFTPLGLILVDEGHGNVQNYNLYYEHLYSLKFPTNHVTSEITPDLLSRHNILITVRATNAFNSNELQAIRDFLDDGGGLFVIGDDDPSVYNSLTDYSGISWNTPQGVGQTVTDINPHNITMDVEEMFLDSPNLVLEIVEPAEEIVYDNSIMFNRPLVAVSGFGNGKIVALTDDNCLDDNNMDSSDNRIFGENVIIWLNNNLPPIPIIDSPADGSSFSSTFLIPFDGSSSYDPDGFIDTYSWTSDIEGLIGSTAVFNTQLSVGVHNITLRVVDNDGQTSPTSVTLTITTPIPPQVSIESPNDGEVVNGLVTISGHAFDSDGTVESVEVRIGGEGWIQATGTYDWEYQWNTTHHSDGDWTIQVRSFDNENQYSDIASITLTVDNTPPKIIAGPTVTHITDTTAVIEWETDEPGDSFVEYGTTTKYGNTETKSSLITEHKIVLRDLTPETAYHYRVETKDALDNIQTGSGDRIFTTEPPPDLTPPEGRITYPLDGETLRGEVVITAEASDDRGVAEVEFYIDNVLMFTDETPGYSWTWDTANGLYPDDHYSVRIIIRDSSGNEDSDEILVTLDNDIILPVIVRERVLPNSVTNNEATEVLFTVEITDQENNLESVNIDLSQISGSSNQRMYDDGSNGDDTTGDLVFSFKAMVPTGTLAGEKSIPITVTSHQGEVIKGSVVLHVISVSENALGGDISKDEKDMLWIVLILVSILVIAILGLTIAVYRKRRSINEIQEVAPLYPTGYYQDETGYFQSE